MKKPSWTSLWILLLLILPFFSQSQNQTDQQLGLQFYSDRDYQKASEVFERLYEAKPDHFAYTYLLQSWLELGETDKAARLVRQQIKRNPRDYKYKVDEGYVLIRSNQSQKAIRLFDDLIKDLEPQQASVFDLANSFMVRREYEYAIKAYQKGRQLIGNIYPFSMELGQMYDLMGQYDKMTEEYLTLLQQQPEYADQVQARLQNSLANDPENLKTEAIRRGLVIQVQKEPDNIAFSEMLVWLSLQLKDFESALIQAKALDRRLGENGSRVYALAQLSTSNGDYRVAADAYNYVITKSDDPALKTVAEAGLLLIEYELITKTYPIDDKKLTELTKRYRATIENNKFNTLIYPLARNLAHIEAFFLNNTMEAISILNDLITKTASDKYLQAECKMELADIYLLSGEPWEATLLYSQVDKAFKNDPVGHEAKFRNARLSFYIGEFDWARAQLDVLKAATSKLIANDAMEMSLLISDNIEADSITLPLESFARADLMLFRNQTSASLALLDSIMLAFPRHSITDDILMKKAEIYQKNGQFTEAAALYQRVVDEFNYDIHADDALFQLAGLYRNPLNDPAKAMEYLQKLMKDFPGSLYVVEARKQFRQLRGDFKETL